MLLLGMAMTMAAAAADSPGSDAGAAPARSIGSDRWVLFRDYPAEALRERRAGVVTMTLHVSRRGTVDACDVIQSSGHEDLDRVSCRLMGERGHYEPARDASGRRIATRVQHQIIWDPRVVAAAQ